MTISQLRSLTTWQKFKVNLLYVFGGVLLSVLVEVVIPNQQMKTLIIALISMTVSLISMITLYNMTRMWELFVFAIFAPLTIVYIVNNGYSMTTFQKYDVFLSQALLPLYSYIIADKRYRRF